MSPSPSRSIADLTEGTILASVDIAVPPERVFRAITDGTEIIRWWGSAETYRTTKWDSNLQVGGEWRAEGLAADGVPFTVGGKFLEIEPPHRLVHTWAPLWDGGNETVVTYTLATTPTGTHLTLSHTGFKGRPESCQGHSSGWAMVLGWLAAELVPPAADTAKYFFCQLVPPRPDFAFTLTPDERAMMTEHGIYWRRRMFEGTVVVFGPVNDPQGPWGLGVVRVNSEADLKDFQNQDPAIISGRGFRYESIPMLAAIWRQP
ncbi:MAG TPA: SRPBCC domain-containing protein [Devosiaceae bacterium]|jgi:uncharacterized protein YndB with AHSA1/START domain